VSACSREVDLQVLNPATERPIAELQAAGLEQTDRALRVARGVESGTLSVNSNTSVRVPTPFGGFKQSGLDRELGRQALDGCSEVKNVYFSTEA
jgi:acyl-CoA reductase-like NAD-dependent aldehyde dehydrogenase